MWLDRSNRTKLHVDAQKLMPYLCHDAQASFSSILALRLMAVIIATSYWCSRCCHPFVPLLVTLTYSSKTVHERIVRVRWWSSFIVKLRNLLLQIYGLQIVLIFTPYTIEYEVLWRIVFIRRQFETWRSEAVLDWHMERTVAEYRWWCCRRMAEETQGLREGKKSWTFAVITDLELAWLCS